MTTKGHKRKPARIRFAENLRAIRIKQGLSQEDLAELADLHRTYIGSIERGERKVSVDNMEAIADALRVPLARMVEE